MLLNSRASRVGNACSFDHASIVNTSHRPRAQIQALKLPDRVHAPALAIIGVALLTSASPATAIGRTATIIKDELTMPSAAPEVIAPQASLEQLPKAPSPATQPQQESRGSVQVNDSAMPGEPATPPPPKKRLSRLQELQQARDDLRAKQQELLRQTDELREKEQTISILQEELEVERVLRALLENDKDKAEEMAKLATGLCSGAMMPP